MPFTTAKTTALNCKLEIDRPDRGNNLVVESAPRAETYELRFVPLSKDEQLSGEPREWFNEPAPGETLCGMIPLDLKNPVTAAEVRVMSLPGPVVIVPVKIKHPVF